MPTYEHRAGCCGHEWEEFYSITTDPPTVCPSCKEEGQVKRLISGGSGRGIVTLSGGDLAAHLKSQGQKMRREVATNENLKANILGESNYHNSQLENSKLEKDLVKIGKDAASIKSLPGVSKKK